LDSELAFLLDNERLADVDRVAGVDVTGIWVARDYPKVDRALRARTPRLRCLNVERVRKGAPSGACPIDLAGEPATRDLGPVGDAAQIHIIPIGSRCLGDAEEAEHGTSDSSQGLCARLNQVVSLKQVFRWDSLYGACRQKPSDVGSPHETIIACARVRQGARS
jgi:hypothetical protein